ncbi:MAG TPA: FAD-binding oxidoreductase [Nitrospirales bacterium]|nr:FAD-binding oxidoreductase [Nitrospirales bacterium]
MRIHGWGGYPTIDAEVLTPLSQSECGQVIGDHPVIARGMGRSYGDSANAHTVIQTTYLDHYMAFDQEAGVLTCEAGVPLRELLNFIVPKAAFIPVTPGTSYVSVGGMIAGDVHGKNHHVAGTFCQHVQSLNLMLGTGEVVTISPTQMPELFHATCGGMGLTGIILSATIKLQPISSSNIILRTMKAGCLEEVCEQFETHAASTYSVAWIDCLANGKQIGRSVLMLGEHAEDGKLRVNTNPPIAVPSHMPASLLNKWSVKAFNAFYYAKAKHGLTETIPFQPYFYPLDKLANWNRLYGKQGFVQYQLVLPKTQGVAGMRAILTKIVASGRASFLAVLKMFGPQNDNLLSFPMAGYTLALDFKMSKETITLLHELDDIVVSSGGRIYLTKDALMTEATFKASYPRWQEFEEIRHKHGAIGKFGSAQSKRLGLA